jgi:hypothetical protein
MTDIAWEDSGFCKYGGYAGITVVVDNMSYSMVIINVNIIEISDDYSWYLAHRLPADSRASVNNKKKAQLLHYILVHKYRSQVCMGL